MNANQEIIAELRRVLGERDAAREQLDLTKRELGRWVDREAQAVRECDELRAQRGLALGRLENEIKAANQARAAEERARESLDELDAAIYDCLPSDYDDDSPLDCVEHAADRLRDLAEERDEWRDKFHALNQTAGELCDACGWRFKIPCEPCRCEVVRERDELRADMREFVRQVENAYELLKPLEEGSDVVERAVSHLLTVLRGRERPGPWAFDAVLRERDEVQADLEDYRARNEVMRIMLERCATERDEVRAEVEELRRDVECLRLGLTVSNEAYRAGYKAGSRDSDAYRRGAEAMREAAINYARKIGFYALAADIRCLPIPEEP